MERNNTEKNNVEFFITHGPSIYMECGSANVVFDFEDIFGAATPISYSHLKYFKASLPDVLSDVLDLEKSFDNIADLIADFSNILQCVSYSMPLSYRTGFTNDKAFHISISYYSQLGALSALRFSYSVIDAIFHDVVTSSENLKRSIIQHLEWQKGYQPDQTSVAMLNSAKNLNIPIYQFLNAKVFCYGQGKNSLLFKSASNNLDSGIGIELQQNKVTTNIVIQGMGYPTTEQYVVSNLADAHKVQENIGFPLALKPIDYGKGIGVSSGITSISELDKAFKIAAPYSRQGVLIERHVEGFDHRITVADEQVIGVICRMPAMVIGDGVHSVQELIDLENSRRSQDMKKQGLIVDIKVDDTLTVMLSKAGFDLDSTPNKGVEIPLRSNGNISTGGTFKDVIENIHPDNKRMAIDIARYFRMNIMGLDFMTSDISKSWKEEGAVIEVNYLPGILEELAYSQLVYKFSTRNMGRIETILLVGLSGDALSKVVEELYDEKIPTALVSANEVSLMKNKRNLKNKSIHEKCLALIRDPACEKMIVSIEVIELEQRGLPLDKFDSVLVAQNSKNYLEEKCLLNLLREHSNELKFI